MGETKMMFSPLTIATIFAVLSLFQTPALSTKDVYIVYMGVNSYGLGDDLNRVSTAEESHLGVLESVLGRSLLDSSQKASEKAEEAMFYSYTAGDINGFAAILDEDEAAKIAEHPEVVSVFLNRVKKLHTTHSWDFLSLEHRGKIPKNSIWNKANYGENVIIGNLDTGVWPESRSFSDRRFRPLPSKWKGSCDTTDRVSCNRKLIGATYYNKFANRSGKPINGSVSSARDYEGHGSHTLSTAAGNFVRGANVFGLLNGTAKGGSPNARVAAYKVCWPTGCFDGDILAAFDASIKDGVDILSVSLGGEPAAYFNDPISIGAFHAVMNGIVVVASAGNEGPLPGTVSNLAPWIFTVAASTMDRDIDTFVELHNGRRFKGTSITKALPEEKQYPLISGAMAKAANANVTDAELCKSGVLDREKVKGKILVCRRGDTDRIDKGVQASLAGAVGMILCNDEIDGNEIISDPHYLPAANINYTDGVALFTYINSTKHPMGYISPARVHLNTTPAPSMAAFSSVGPNPVTPNILKPDITAPGVNVIAAYTGASSPTEYPRDKRRTPFTFLSGTSMSCPHVTGVVGLLKKLHPQWSPAAIKSAIMTTAITLDNTGNRIRDLDSKKATPFNYGSGHLRPDRAADPGLVYDLGVDDYLYFLCAIGYNNNQIKRFTTEPYECPKNASLLNFNYPSITVTNITEAVTVSRKLKNVGVPGVYKAQILQPRGVSVHVEPEELKFDKVGEEKSFKLTLKNEKKPSSNLVHYEFGELVWADERHHVRSPIVVGLN